MSPLQAELDARCRTNADQRASLRRGEKPASTRLATGFLRVGGAMMLLPLVAGAVVFAGIVVWAQLPPIAIVGAVVMLGLFAAMLFLPAVLFRGVRKALDAPIRVEELEVRLITREATRTRTHHHHFSNHHGHFHDHSERYAVREAVLVASDGRHFIAPDGLADMSLEGRFRLLYREPIAIAGIAPASAGHVLALEVVDERFAA